MSVKTSIIILATYAAAAVYILTLCREVRTQGQEIERLEQNVSSFANDRRYFKVRDSLRAVETSALILTNKELKRLRAEDARLIADLKKRPKDVATISKMEIVTKDSVVYVLRDSCIHYADQWATIDACLTDSTLTYSVKDSITNVLYIDYQRRFLWWRWKPIYKVITASYNPHTEIINAETMLLTSHTPR